MKKLLITSLLCAVAAMTSTATTRTFTAACYNVDGLPFFNSDGPKETGSEAMSKLIAEKGWDFFGVSEDFGFHDQLISALENYNIGTWRGTVTTKNSSAENMADTDGLCFMWKKGIEVTGEKWVGWNKKFGGLTNGADECIDKGYRYYCVNIGDGFEIDVYTLHMNSGSDPGHLEARAIQLTQLADAIIASDNKRPIIIMGDTNCRWTRDGLKDLLFGAVNADPRFTMNDPWVDYMWNGWQPSAGGSIMVSDYGNQKGEVVDKIFYINNTDAKGIHLQANGYLHDDSFSNDSGKGFGDHFPIVIEFTIEDNYVAPEPGTDDDKGLTGEYYLINEGTGKYLCTDGAWGTHACIGEIGNRINFFKGDAENTYGMRSTSGFINDPASDTGADIYMDAPKPRYYTFTPEGDSYVITYINEKNEKMALTAVPDDAMASTQGKAFAEGDKNQLWTLVPEQDLIDALSKATTDDPVDATFLIRGYNIGVNDSDNNAWKYTCGNATYAKQETWGPNEWNTKTWVYRCYNKLASKTKPENTAWTVEQVVKNLPNGSYQVTCQLLTDNVVDADGFTYSLNGQKVDGVKALEGGTGTTLTSEKAVELFATPGYEVTADVKVTDNTLTIRMERAAHAEKSSVCFDNFKLTYFGDVQSGISSVNAADSDAPAVYYNLQGVRVENPESGLYIVKRGNTVTKEIIRK